MSAILIDTLGSTEGGSIGVSGANRDVGAPTAHFTLAPIRGSSPKTDTR